MRRIDYNGHHDRHLGNDPLVLLSTKRAEFKHEAELRFIAALTPDEQTILTIAQIDPLRVEVILPTHLFGSVRVGDLVEIIPEPPLDQPHVAEVALVDRVLDGASGTFGVRLLLANPDHDLPGGLRCQARLMPPGSELEAARVQASGESSVAR